MTIFLEMTGAAFLLILGLMFLLWLVYVFKRNAGIVDIGWTLSFPLAAWAYFFIGEGLFSKKLILTAMVTTWALRLAGRLWQRFLKSPEDKRYVALRESWGRDKGDFKFLMLFLFQGLLAVVLTLPFLIVNAAAKAPWQQIEIIAIFIWLIGFVGETLADKQLDDFKENSDNQGKVLDKGLWYFSRHPNYFFEFIVWVGFFLFALGTSWGGLAIISPLIMLGLLTQVSGIPMTEKEVLKTKGDAYAEYQRKTSAFIPWFPQE